MTRTVICDIDGTVANCNHRLHHVTNGNRNWDSFFAEMNRDAPIEPVIEVVTALENFYDIVFCSGRPEMYREVTMCWLEENVFPPHALYMRPDSDHRADYLVKADMLQVMRKDGFDPFIVIDDRPSVVKMWRENGLICLQAADWDERRSHYENG